MSTAYKWIALLLLAPIIVLGFVTNQVAHGWIQGTALGEQVWRRIQEGA